MEIIRERREKVIASVLDAQDTLPDVGPDMKAHVLGARYKNLSRTTLRFAKTIADGDAQIAAEYCQS